MRAVLLKILMIMCLTVLVISPVMLILGWSEKCRFDHAFSRAYAEIYAYHGRWVINANYFTNPLLRLYPVEHSKSPPYCAYVKIYFVDPDAVARRLDLPVGTDAYWDEQYLAMRHDGHYYLGVYWNYALEASSDPKELERGESVDYYWYYLQMPCFYPPIAAAIVAGWLLWRNPKLFLGRWLIKPGHCPDCGFDLRASPERCPECGQTRNIDPTSPTSSSAQHDTPPSPVK